MRVLVTLVFLLLSVILIPVSPAAEPLAVQSSIGSSTNNLDIACTNGATFSASAAVAVFRGAVQVLESQMYMECELLTVFFQTNRAANPGGATLTNLNRRVETIIAETNLMLMTRDSTIIGDRAVYTQSNEVVVVTGLPVIIETERGYTYGTNFVFDRRTGEGYALGPTLVEIKMDSSAGGTNLPPPKLGIGPERPNRPPGNRKPK